MPVGTNFPVESIEDLSAQLKSQADNLRTNLDTLYGAVQRDPNFLGNAADQYDQYLVQWRQGQTAMIDGLTGAGELLAQLGARLRELNQGVAAGFNV